MYKVLNISKIQLFICLSGIINLYYCASNVRMEVSVNENYMTLSCYVINRDDRKNIYLQCPLVSNYLNCLENCIAPCQGEPCRVKNYITCVDKGLDAQRDMHRIDYVIDGTKVANKGNWNCQYGGQSSQTIHVNVTSSKSVVPIRVLTTTTRTSEPSVIKPQNEKVKAPDKESPLSTKTEEFETLQYDKILTRTEFIITVVGLLALSLLFNLIFCGKMIMIHCRSKKKEKNTSQYLLSNNNHPPYNHSNSQVSDPERIYEDTSFNHRQMSFLTQIKNGNGTYLSPSTLAPSGFSTLLPHPPFTRSFSIPNSASESGSQQVTYPILTDPSQSNYTSVNFPTENNYTNFVSVQPEMCLHDGNTMPQPVYLAFQSPHPMLTAGSRYVHYGNQPLQSVATMSNDRGTCNRTDTSNSLMMPHSSSTNFVTGSDEGKSNYQISREMMEEADNLLRTADTLLKSTENEIHLYQQ